MKRRFAIIMAALLIAAMAGCSQSGTSSTADSDTVQSSADSSVAESAESEISEAESSVVSEVTSTESSEEKSETSAAESSENKSKTESSKPKNEESSKPENSKAETSKAETSKPVESSNPVESSKPVESSTPSKKPEESSTPSSTPKQEVKATGITLDLSSLSLTSGSTQELNAYILWSNGTSSYQGITWSTSNNGVATVSSSGYVTAKSAGTATITASYGSYSKSCTVTVKAAQSSQPTQPSGGNGGTQTQPSQSLQPSGGGNSGNGGSGNGGSGNGGSGGQTSKPSGGNNGGGSSGNSGSNNGGSGSSGSNNGGPSDNGGSGSTQTYVPFNESTHKKVYSPKGYEMYEVPEIVEYINVYRRQLGLSDVTWTDTTENRQAIIDRFNSKSEDELNEWREAYGDIYFDNNGKFNIDKYEEYNKKKTTRAALEYCLDTKTLQHGGQHESMINSTSFKGNNVKLWVENIKNSPMHWDILMKPKLRTIYCVAHVGDNGGIIFSIN